MNSRVSWAASKQRASSSVRRFCWLRMLAPEFHYVLKHASWLNMVLLRG
jgi:hypothetical protein